MRLSVKAGTALVLGLAAGCTSSSNNTFSKPSINGIAKLQVAVGTATFPDGSVNLNVVTTFRDKTGLSPSTNNTPTLTGPSGFSVPSVPDAGSDAGTNRITATFGMSGGAFAYGFAPDNTTALPSYVPYGGNGDGAPFYAAQFQALPATTGWPFQDSAKTVDYVPFLGGPPLFPYSQNGTYPIGFYGFPEGFTTFAAKPVAGSYSLSVSVPTTPQVSGGTVNATAATLSSVAGLPAYPAPTFVEDGSGGGTVSVVAPAGVTETLVQIVDITTPSFYALEITGAGAGSAALPDALGPAAVGATAPSLKAGDTYIVTAIGCDYPAFEAAQPGNGSQTPTLTGGAGQTDLTISPFLAQAYGGGAVLDARPRTSTHR